MLSVGIFLEKFPVLFGDVFVLMMILGHAKPPCEHLSYPAAAPPFSEETPKAFLPLTDKESKLFAQNNRGAWLCW